MLLIFIIYPIFKKLASKNKIMTITWCYVFTVVIVITFAIEIGQGFTGTGSMEFADIMFGVLGFIAMYIVFVGVIAFFKAIGKLFKKGKKKDK